MTATATQNGVHHETIADELKAVPNWVLWKTVERDGELSKVPYNTITKDCAKTNDPSTWGPYQSAITKYAILSKGQYSGIGFVFSRNDDFCGIDFDGCRDPNTGEIEPWAREAIDRLNSYTEVSPSGTGVKVFIRGKSPLPSGKKKPVDAPQICGKTPAIEVYDERRFFAVTGQRLEGTPATVESRQDALNWLASKFWPPRTSTLPPSNGRRRKGSVSAVERCRRYVAKMEPAVSGQGGHNQAFNVACEIWRFGLDDPDARAVFAEFNERCEPPWSDSELEHKLTSALDEVKSQGQFGSRLEESKPAKSATAHPIVTNVTPSNGDGLSILNPQTHTDVGNAQRFIALHGENIRYVDAWGKFLWWDGKRWAIDKIRRIEHLAKDVSAKLFAEIAANMAKIDDGAVDALVRFAKATANDRNIRNFLNLVRSDSRVASLPELFDVDPWLFNATNGTIDLRTGELRPHSRGDYLTKLGGCDYDADGATLEWDRFLKKIFDGKQSLIDFLQRFAGYSLTGSVAEQKLIIAHGVGANGKTTYINAQMEVLGEYAHKAPHDFLVESGNRHPTEKADLHGKRFVACAETGEGRRLAESLVKELTGSEEITARRMREDHWSFSPTHKIVIATNHKPRVSGTDHAIWRRVRLVPFEVTIPDDEQDKQLAEKLAGELPGILAWMVRGCLDWQRSGLREPEEVVNATKDYRSSQDTLAKFLQECCIEVSQASVKLSSLRKRYLEWCEDQGEQPVSGRKFGEFLTEKGFERYTSNGTRYRGLGIPANEKSKEGE